MGETEVHTLKGDNQFHGLKRGVVGNVPSTAAITTLSRAVSVAFVKLETRERRDGSQSTIAYWT